MKSVFSFLCICVFTSSSLLAQDTNTTNLIANVDLKKADTYSVKASTKTSASRSILNKQPVTENKQHKPAKARRNHRAVIDSIKRTASKY